MSKILFPPPIADISAKKNHIPSNQFMGYFDRVYLLALLSSGTVSTF